MAPRPMAIIVPAYITVNLGVSHTSMSAAGLTARVDVINAVRREL